MVSSFSFSQLKIIPPITRPAITSRKSTGENQPIIIATWYRLKAAAICEKSKYGDTRRESPHRCQHQTAHNCHDKYNSSGAFFIKNP